MAESEIIIPLEILQLIDEHRQLVRDKATSSSKIDNLEGFAPRVPARNSAQALSPLTAENTPISELNAVLQQLPYALSQIDQLEEARKQHQRRAMQQNQFQPSSMISRPSPAPVPPSTPPFAGCANVSLWIRVGTVVFIFIIIILFLLLRH
jgi:hypothetical protein